MSGGGGGVIIIKNLKTALSLSAIPSGKVRVWHVFVLTHLLTYLAGKLF